MKRNIVIVFLLINSFILYGASALDKANAYAQANQEYVEPDNKNYVYPNFSSYYKSRLPNFFTSFRGIKTFSMKDFRDKIMTLADLREKRGFSGNFVQSMKITPKSTVIVWGDIFGAYHSLVRSLGYLEQQGFIDKDLKIIKNDCYFVFNGNVIDRSPYTSETLSLVIDLMLANPDTVFYIRGSHEDKQEWHSYSLARELQIRARSLSTALIPFSDSIDRLFNSLPLALYLSHTDGEIINLVRISYYNRSNMHINEKFIAKAFHEQQKPLETIPLVEKEEEDGVDGKISLRAIVVGERRNIVYKYSEGLLEAKTQEEATAWTLFSAPTFVYQKLCDFFFDAFAMINIADIFTDTTISLYNQDARKKDGFAKKNTFNLFTTQRTQEGLPAQPELLFAATMDFSKSTNTIGKRVDDGLHLRFEVEQDKGGIKGYQPRILTFDDQYTPNLTRQKVEFIKNELKVDKLVGSQGSPSLESYFDFVKKGELLVMFPFTGAPIFRAPDLRYILHGARVSYSYEGEFLAQYAYEELKAKRIALFYQNDSFGKGILVGAQEYFKDKKDVVILDLPHERNDVAFEEQAKKMKAFDPEAVLFFVTSSAARALITQMGVDYFINRKLLAASVFEGAFEHFINDLGLKFIFTCMVPNPKTSNLEIVKEYRENAKKYDIKVDKLSLEMYINASILFDLIGRLEGEITKESIIDTAEKTHNYDLKGLALDFNPKTRELSHSMWLDTGSQDWKEIDTRSLALYNK